MVGYSWCNMCTFPTTTNFVVRCRVVASVVFFHKWLTGELNVNELSSLLSLGPLNCASFPHPVLSNYASSKVLQILVFPSLLPFSWSACFYPSLYNWYGTYSRCELGRMRTRKWILSGRQEKALGMLFPPLVVPQGHPHFNKTFGFEFPCWKGL